MAQYVGPFCVAAKSAAAVRNRFKIGLSVSRAVMLNSRALLEEMLVCPFLPGQLHSSLSPRTETYFA